ncbi:major facilitator superfamily domain-containing protein [Gymnopilus junonius]|uniref:Major facilitator superfamily domain-containing protein n=1 Tax=Gymnopilus junonius TaxID=109634 RepID=A0A9P5NR54_GYMJU|nr:major facilitator superfamily domain-containing protein [Gymnopilus junonius]
MHPPHYSGCGTPHHPYVVHWDLHDPHNPYNWPRLHKWLITAQLALTTFTVSFSSSVYSGGLVDTMRDLHVSSDIAILGISLYVLGFALGPLIFASMGEMFGRRVVFLVTLSLYTVFQLQGALGRNLGALLSCRLLTGIFGSSPLTNAGGVVSDIWNFRERGLASAIYSTVPFLGPVIGPIVGGFVVQNPHLSWRFNFWLMFTFAGLSLIAGYFWAPETYAPVLLRWRAEKLSRASNGTIHYISVHDVQQSRSFAKVMRTNLCRPFIFLVTEPIVLLLAIYVSILYGTLYALFSGFPIVFQDHRHFTPGEGGLAFLGVGIGITCGTASQTIQNRIYWKSMDKSSTGRAPPEARLHMAILGAVLAPIGLWWFAWTSRPSIHWIVPILAGIPFGTGISQILQSLTTYLMDTYNIYFASAIAATVVLRSICGAAFPLFSPSMFNALGDEWAMSVFACLSTACMPIPLLFWKYGWWIRQRSRFAFKELPGSEPNASFSSTMYERDLVTPTSGPAITMHKKTLTIESVLSSPAG